MVQLRVLLTDLRRAESTAAKETDRVKAAARASLEAPAQHAPHGGNRRTSGADDLRTQSKDILSARPEDPKPDEAEGTESMAEDDEQEANAVLREGLEQAIRKKEVAIEAYPTYVPDTDTGEDEQTGRGQDGTPDRNDRLRDCDRKGMGGGKEDAVQRSLRCTEVRRRMESVPQAHE